MKVTLIHNPSAGKGDRSDGDKLVGLIRAAGHQVQHRSTKDDDWQRLLLEPADLEAAAGGDGTVAKVARRLVGTGIPFAILPQGTANNIACTLQPDQTSLSEIIARWPTARRATVDVGVACALGKEKYFLEAVGTGFFAWTTARAEDDLGKNGQKKDPKRELQLVRRHLREQLVRFTPHHVEITLDGQDLAGEYLLVEAMNIRSIGPNLLLAPQADPGDGLLELVLVSAEERDKLAKRLSDEPATDDTDGGFATHRGQHLSMQTNASGFHLDDRPWPDDGKTNAIEVRVKPHALEVVIPNSV